MTAAKKAPIPSTLTQKPRCRQENFYERSWTSFGGTIFVQRKPGVGEVGRVRKWTLYRSGGKKTTQNFLKVLVIR